MRSGGGSALDQWDSYHCSAGRKEYNRKRKKSHKLPPHSLIFTNKAKEQNISIFFLFFCPKSISIFNTTAFCNRWTTTHGQSKPGNIKTFSIFLVGCDFWKQCLGEMHFFTFTQYPFLMGNLDITTLWRTERKSHGESHVRKMRQTHCQDASWLDTLHFQSCTFPRGFCRERWCLTSPQQKAGYGTERAGSWLAHYFDRCTQASQRSAQY